MQILCNTKPGSMAYSRVNEINHRMHKCSTLHRSIDMHRSHTTIFLFFQIVMNASNIYFNKLKVADVSGSLQTYPNAREVCMCADGSLFLAPATTGLERCLVTSGVC